MMKKQELRGVRTVIGEKNQIEVKNIRRKAVHEALPDIV